MDQVLAQTGDQEFIKCTACGVRVGDGYAQTAALQEFHGQEKVCPSCWESLARRRTSARQSLFNEGTLRAPVVLPVPAGPRRRGRRPRVRLELN